MSKRSRRNRNNPLALAASSLGGLVGTTLAAAGGWIAYSNLAINHNLPLPKAIDADTVEIFSGTEDSATIYLDRSGTGTPIFLVHSVNAAASAYEMAPIFNYYRGKRPVYAIDLPGFGLSSRVNRYYSPRVYQEAILEALGSQVQAPADLIALSLGSEFAARAAVIGPELVRSLTLISPTGFNQRSLDRAAQGYQEGNGSQKVHAWLSMPLWGRPLYDLIVTRPSIKYFLEKSFVGPIPQEMLDYDYATSHQPGAQNAPLYFLSGSLFTRGILPAFYERLEMPVLVVYDEDAFTSFELLPEVVASHDQWKAVRIQPTRGLPQWERMEALAVTLNDFWSDLEKPAPTL